MSSLAFCSRIVHDCTMFRESEKQLTAGQKLARGVCRHLNHLNFASLTEFVPTRGLRADVMAIGPKGEFWIIECKSGRADFNSDHKWQGYLEWCDRFFWAVDTDFPLELLPAETGLFLADSHDAEIIRTGKEMPLAAARRKSLSLKFARTAANKLQGILDPGVTALRVL